MSVETTLEFIKDIAHRYHISGIYIVGGAVRDEILYGKIQEKSDIDITSLYPNRAVELGGLIAGELGQNIPKILHRTGTLNLNVFGTDIDFKGDWIDNSGYTEKMRELGIEVTPLTKDVYSRDLTINSLLKSLFTNKIIDISKKGVEDIKNKKLRTLLPAEFICKNNPLIILRAMRFAIYLGFEIDAELNKAMKKYSQTILKHINIERAEKEILKMLSKDTTRTLEFLKEYNLINVILPDIFQDVLKLSPAIMQEI